MAPCAVHWHEHVVIVKYTVSLNISDLSHRQPASAGILWLVQYSLYMFKFSNFCTY